MFNFKWQPTSSGIKFDRLGGGKKPQDGFGMGSSNTTFNATMAVEDSGALSDVK